MYFAELNGRELHIFNDRRSVEQWEDTLKGRYATLEIQRSPAVNLFDEIPLEAWVRGAGPWRLPN